ncbi:MAG: hypothetical protein K2M57_05625 [Paramuribaculum sp.]|nr:hypothetical protein [Paramuribaculum sp.]
MKSRIIIAAAGCIALCTQAQTTSKTQADNGDQTRLKKEITVDRSIVPQLREAKRLNMSPIVELPTTTATKLDYSPRTVTARVPALFTTLNPAAYGDSIATDHTRGYLTLGYGPTFDAMASGGFQLIDTKGTKLGAWLQYDGYMFHDNVYYGTRNLSSTSEQKALFRNNNFKGGLSLSQATGKNSVLDIDLVYGFGKVNCPDLHTDLLNSYYDPNDPRFVLETNRHHINRFDGKAALKGSTASLVYSIGAKYEIFAFGNTGSSRKSDKENIFGVEASIQSNPENESQGLVSVSYTSMHDTHTPWEYREGEDKSYTQGLATIMPTYRYKSEQFTADLGLRLDISHNSGKTVHVAPNIKLAWLPTEQVTVWAKAGGGEVQNTLASIYSFTPYITPLDSYGNSNVPVTIDGGITVGPFSGAYVKLYGGWAKAKNWLVPGSYSWLCDGYSMDMIDISGYHAGITAGYSYRRLAEIEVSAEIAPQGEDKGYYLWRDRAKQVISATLTVHPLEQLDVNAGWELRSGRITNEKYGVDPGFDIDRISNWLTADYPTLSNVSLGARWRFNRNVSAFADVQNLLNHKNVTYIGEGARGIHGMIGVALKF